MCQHNIFDSYCYLVEGEDEGVSTAQPDSGGAVADALIPNRSDEIVCFPSQKGDGTIQTLETVTIL